jgi:hypothetical protein
LSQFRTEAVVSSAPGRFAPGHLGELTQLVPFEMVDEALAETRAVQCRVRDLPSRVVVYLLLAACLFEDVGYPGVWRKLTAGLRGAAVAAPTAGAMSQARRRVGAAPLRFLFDLVRGPAPGGAARWRGLLVTAIDGTTMTAADSTANLARFTKPGSHNGGSGYPLVRVLLLVACGTRTIIDAVFGPAGTGEVAYAGQLLGGLRPGMIVLADRNFAARALITSIRATGAHVLVRVRDDRRLPVLRYLPDGSALALMGQDTVRVITCQVTITTAAGHRTGTWRLLTTLLDHRRYPAIETARLYHERWEIETSYLEIKSVILRGRVLRARTPAGIEQEIWALLTTYQVLRTAMADAAASRPGTDPDRGSFTIALQAARDQVIQAAGILAGAVIDLTGVIGRQILAALMTARRTRTSTRVVKRAISKYVAKGPVTRTTRKATITTTIIRPPNPASTSP